MGQCGDTPNLFTGTNKAAVSCGVVHPYVPILFQLVNADLIFVESGLLGNH